MPTADPGEFDLADIDVTAPPEGWVADISDEDPDPADAIDDDQEAGE